MHYGEKTGGRKKGTLDKVATKASEKRRIEKMIKELIPDALDITAHTMLMMVYRDPKVDLTARIRAAVGALPYELPKMPQLILPVDPDPLFPMPGKGNGKDDDLEGHPLREGLLAAEAAGNA